MLNELRARCLTFAGEIAMKRYDLALAASDGWSQIDAARAYDYWEIAIAHRDRARDYFARARKLRRLK